MTKKKPSKDEVLITHTYNNLVQFVINSFLFNIYGILLKSKVCPATSQAEWLKTLAVMHVKGWLYYGYENGEVKVVVGAYRMKEFDEKKTDVLPKKEEGDILYVAFMASIADDKLLPKKLLTQHLEKNKNIKEVILYRRNSDTDLSRIKVNRKEESNVKAENAGGSGVPAESVPKQEFRTADASGARS